MPRPPIRQTPITHLGLLSVACFSLAGESWLASISWVFVLIAVCIESAVAYPTRKALQ